MMTTTSILLSHLRRSRPYYSLLPTLFSAHQSIPNPNPHPLSPPPHTRFTPRVNPLLFHSRAFSTPLGGGGGDVLLQEDSILPVRHLISLLDAYHDLTGLPWWIVIASSTLALRVVLFPVLILQLNKLKRIGELFPKCCLMWTIWTEWNQRSFEDNGKSVVQLLELCQRTLFNWSWC